MHFIYSYNKMENESNQVTISSFIDAYIHHKKLNSNILYT